MVIDDSCTNGKWYDNGSGNTIPFPGVRHYITFANVSRGTPEGLDAF
jgi:hypothetical protein